MTLTPMHRTGLFFLCLLLFLFQMGGVAYIVASAGYLIIFCLCVTMILKSDEFRVGWLSGFALLFSLYLFIGLFWSEIPSKAGFMILTYALPCVLLITAFTTKEKLWIEFDVFYKGIVGACSCVSVYAIYQFATNSGVYEGASNYPFFNPNSLAVFLGMGTIICFRHLLENKSWCYGVLIFVLIAGIVTTQSRASVFLLPILSGGMVLYHWHVKNWCVQSIKQGVILWAVLFTCLMAFPFLLDYIFSDKNALAQSLDLSASALSSRITIWQSAINSAVSTHPIIGNGVGTFRDIYSEYRQLHDRTMGLHAHNDLLHLWVEIGSVGVLIIAGLIIGFSKAAINIWCYRQGHKIMSLFIVAFLFGMAIVTPVILLPPFMLVLGVALVDLGSVLKSKQIKSYFLTQATILFFILIICFTSANGVQHYFVAKVGQSLKDQNIEEFFTSIDMLDIVSLGLHPNVPAMKATLLLTLYDEKLLEDNQYEDALLELESYIKDAYRRNPHSSDILFFKGELALRKGVEDDARNLYAQALHHDPMHVKSRLKLVEMTQDIDKKLTLLRDGFHYKYWQKNPQKLYGTAMIMGKDYNDIELFNMGRTRLEHQMRLK